MSIDLSTSSTGLSYFNKEGELLHYDYVKPSGKGMSGMKYPEKQFETMCRMSDLISHEILQLPNIPDYIVIEEIAGSSSRAGQKTLDGMHWVLVGKLAEMHMIDRIHYYDVTGAKGWRYHLNLKLSEADKAANKEAKKLNKIIGTGHKKIPIINAKHLAQRYVNEKFGLLLDVDENKHDNDMADSIAMGDSFYIHKAKLI